MFPMEIVKNNIAALVCGLLHMSFLSVSIAETMHLGILSLSYHIFLQWQDLGFLSFRFPSIYETIIFSLNIRGRFSPAIMLWLLMVGGLSGSTTLEDKWRKVLCNKAWTCVKSNLEISYGAF